MSGGSKLCGEDRRAREVSRPADPLRDPLIFAGRTVDRTTGRLTDRAGALVNWEMVPVRAGTAISHPGDGRLLEMHFYDAVIPDRYVHTYDYEPESNGTTYRPDLSKEVPQDGCVAERDGYVRLVLQDETAVDADLEQLADAVMLGDGSASYTRRSEGYAERVTVTIRFPETFVRDALAGPAVRETIQIRTLTRYRLPAPEIIRLIRAARKLSGKE